MGGLSSKFECSAFFPCARLCVSDDNRTVGAERFADHRDHRGMDMHSVDNELTCHLWRKRNSAERPWLAVQERAHSVAAVGYMSDAHLNGFECLFKGRVRVAN